ncbi:MAG: SH3 domain-containing protein, partial [Kiritimatiellae bacterium]|nr:SH3 domain-containing protein [Kiritimatiellia bacterium]
QGAPRPAPAVGSRAVVAASTAARFAPSKTAAKLFDAAAGATVEIRETSGSWVRALFRDGSTGWLPSSSVETD